MTSSSPGSSPGSSHYLSSLGPLELDPLQSQTFISLSSPVNSHHLSSLGPLELDPLQSKTFFDIGNPSPIVTAQLIISERIYKELLFGFWYGGLFPIQLPLDNTKENNEYKNKSIPAMSNKVLLQLR